jgi:hypothetical protein
MTRARNQLRFARQAYRTARYPGDLSKDLLPQSSALARAFSQRRWVLVGGVGASAAAAVVLLALLLTRASEVSPRWPAVQADHGGLVDWLPVAPEKMPLPHFEGPLLPISPPSLRIPLQLPAGIEGYQDLAMQYRRLGFPESLTPPSVPTIPTDLPTRGVEWLHKVWTGEKSA